MNAYITVSHKGSCLKFHMTSPCPIVFHGLAVFLKWDLVFDKWLKHLTILLLNIAPISDLSCFIKDKNEKTGNAEGML